METEEKRYVVETANRCGRRKFRWSFDILDEANVAVIPGKPFGSPHHIRLSFAISDKAIIEGIRRIKEWVNKL